MNSESPALLAKLVRVLIAEWGIEAVQKAIAEQAPDGQLVDKNRHLPKETRRSKKRTAADFVARAQDAHATHYFRSLLELALRYDRKEFLPSVSDVREFALMQNYSLTKVKDRTEAIRPLFSILQQLPSEKLEELLESRCFSGPATLEPLSDAIKESGAAMRRGGIPWPTK